MRGRLLLLGACAIGAYLIHAARQLASLDTDDLHDVWGDEDEEAL